MRRLFRRPVRDDVASELEFHVAMRAHELTTQGVDPHQARRLAELRFTNFTTIADDCRRIGIETERRMRRTEYLSDLRGDIRLAARQLLRAPAFTLGVVLTLAIGIGVSTTVFSLLDAIFWRWPAGVAAPAAIQRVWTVDRRGPAHAESGQTDLEYPRYLAIAAAAAPAASALYAVEPGAPMRRNGGTSTVRVGYATASYFPLLGAHALMGRVYAADEDRMGAATPVIVVGERFWRTRLGGDPSIVGTQLDIARTKYTVIGVIAAPFSGPDLEGIDAWAPFGGYPGISVGGTPWWQSRNYSGFQMLIRGTAVTRSPSFTARATASLRNSDAAFGSNDSTVRVATGSLIVSHGPGDETPELAIAVRLGGVALMLLLIVVANVLGLMLSRAVRRRHEIAMRLALGISRPRLARLLLTESVMLAVLAGAAAVAASVWGGGLLRVLLFPDMHWAAAPMHWHVVAFAGGAAIVVALVAGLVPLAHLLRSGVAGAVKGQHVSIGRGASRLRTAAVTVQVALSTVLLVGAALFVQSLRNVRQIDVGYDSSRLLYAAVRVNGTTDEQPSAQRVDAVIASLPASAGIERVARTSAVPLQRGGFGIPWYAGRDSMGARANFRPTGSRVTTGYIGTIGLALATGTDLHAGAREVVVNETMARTIWPGETPIGACIHFVTRDAPCHVVVGVVRDAKRSTILEHALPQYFVAADDSTAGLPGADFVALRVAAAEVAPLEALLQQRLGTEFPDARVLTIAIGRTLDTLYRPWRLGALLFGVFGMLALVVASIGVYSTVAYDVAQRARDFGIRAALGAGFGDIVRAVLRAGLSPVAAGIVAGIVASLLGGKLVGALLYGIHPGDIRVMAGAGALLLGAGAVAALVPARRAARSDPLAVLRDQ